jgi:hypothetical protein
MTLQANLQPSELSVALKEWAVVCDALGAGRQIILLRKGGIYESAGEFEIEHRHFLLFPTYLHQNAAMLKDGEHAALKPMTAEPDKIEITLAGHITDILPMTNRAAMDALDGQHIWTSKLIDMRFNYRPENPLYLLLVRTYRLEEIIALQNTPAFAGCKSWVPLDRPIQTEKGAPVLSGDEYARRRRDILGIIATV